MVVHPETEQLLQRAHKQSVTWPVPTQARYVIDALGPRLVTASLGLRDGRTVPSWSAGGPIKSEVAAHRLQILFRVTYAVAEAFSPSVAAAFLRGTNPALGDQAPLAVLATEPPDRSEQQLLSAVEALLTE